MKAACFSARIKLFAAAVLAAALFAVAPGTAAADEVALEEQAGPPPTFISTVYVNGASLYAEDGQFIPFTGTAPDGAHYTVYEERWMTDEAPISSMYNDGANCDAGDPMRYAVILNAESGYAFGGPIKLVLNGKAITAMPRSGGEPLGPYYEFLDHQSHMKIGFYNLAAAPTGHHWTRLWGQTALDTTRAIVQEGWMPGDTDTVVLATMSGYYDALAAAPLAGVHNAPILLTNKNTLSPQALSEIQRLDVDTVIIVGGEAAVSKGIEDKLKGMGYDVQRVWGDNAQLTAADIAKHVGQDAGGMTPWCCILATSKSYHDALAIAPLAWRCGYPIYLTNAKGELSDATLSAMVGAGHSEIIVMGGPSAIPESTVTKLEDTYAFSSIRRIQGATAIDTAVEAARFSNNFGIGVQNIGIATAGGYHDALAGAALCGKRNSVMVLVPKNGAKNPNYAGLDYVETRVSTSSHGYIFGGTAAVSNETLALAEMAISAPVG